MYTESIGKMDPQEGKQLMQMEIDRDNLHARVSDSELFKSGDSNAIRLRKIRREKEMARISQGLQQHLTPPGPWDKDLDLYNDPEYVETRPDGYEIVLKRHMMSWSWNVYVRLPKGHCCEDIDYSFFAYSDDERSFPSYHFTFGEWADKDRTKFMYGIDHQNTYDVLPCKFYQEFFTVYREFFPGWSYRSDVGGYIDREKAIEEGEKLVGYFTKMQGEYSEEILSIKKTMKRKPKNW